MFSKYHQWTILHFALFLHPFLPEKVGGYEVQKLLMGKYYVAINIEVINTLTQAWRKWLFWKINWDQHLLNEVENKNIRMYISTFASINFVLQDVHKAVLCLFYKKSFLQLHILWASPWSSLCRPKNAIMEDVRNVIENKYSTLCLIYINWHESTIGILLDMC